MSTICAIATAQGGAIAVIRTSGPDAIDIAEGIFRGKRKVKDAKPYSILYGRIVDDKVCENEQTACRRYDNNSSRGLVCSRKQDQKCLESRRRSSEKEAQTRKCVPEVRDKSSRGLRPSENEARQSEEVIDEVLLSVFRAPHSYTGEDSVEISCHASPYILTRIISLLIRNGCRMAEPGEFTLRAFLGGKMDLSQAEAVADLIASSTREQHRLAMNQMRGGYSEKLRSLRDKLLHMTSLLELELDFSEEDVLLAPRKELLSLCLEVEQKIQTLVSSFRQGNAIKQGVPVAIVGAPNVGKSTLLNALLQDDRAIVSPVEGTTRDTVEDTLIIDGTLFRIVDTAGIRHAKDSLEQLGIERSLKAARQARIIIIVSEPGVPEPDIPTTPEQTVIHIENKTPAFQAINGTGLEGLKQKLLDATPQPREGQTIVTNLRHYQALTHALADIRRAKDGLDKHLSADLLAQDIRECISHLSEITGDITNDDILQSIFSHFCIGK